MSTPKNRANHAKSRGERPNPVEEPLREPQIAQNQTGSREQPQRCRPSALSREMPKVMDVWQVTYDISLESIRCLFRVYLFSDIIIQI